MAVDERLPQLGCGRTTEQVWAGIDHPPDRHERDCEYCKQARQQLSLLQQAIHSVHDLAPDTEQPGVRVKNAIMDIVRNEIRQGRRIPLEAPAAPKPDVIADGEGNAELAITERALIDVVTQAGDRVASARIRHVRVDASPGRPADRATQQGDGTVLPAALDIKITVSIRAGVVIAQTVARLRDQITSAIVRQVGISVHRIDVAVEDVHEQ